VDDGVAVQDDLLERSIERFLHACSTAKKWNVAMRILSIPGLSLDPKAGSMAIHACGHTGRTGDVLRLLSKVESGHGFGAVVMYTAAITAMGRNGEWKRGLGLLREMQRKGLQPNVMTYYAAISACSRAGRRQVRHRQLQLDRILSS
jgi:pentatricopeptide repeat protein